MEVQQWIWFTYLEEYTRIKYTILLFWNPSSFNEMGKSSGEIICLSTLKNLFSETLNTIYYCILHYWNIIGWHYLRSISLGSHRSSMTEHWINRDNAGHWHHTRRVNKGNFVITNTTRTYKIEKVNSPSFFRTLCESRYTVHLQLCYFVFLRVGGSDVKYQTPVLKLWLNSEYVCVVNSYLGGDLSFWGKQ